MNLPTKPEAKILLEKYVTDEYQRYHAMMVGTAMEGYAKKFGEEPQLWFLTGYLHDIDYEKFPETHPKESLAWFRDWNYPEDLIHSVEAHAYRYNGFETLPQTRLASALMACDEICGIFYAYRKLNPIPYKNMKTSSILKRLNEKGFAIKIDREVVQRGVGLLGVTIEEHVANLISFFAELE